MTRADVLALLLLTERGAEAQFGVCMATLRAREFRKLVLDQDWLELRRELRRSWRVDVCELTRMARRGHFISSESWHSGILRCYRVLFTLARAALVAT